MKVTHLMAALAAAAMIAGAVGVTQPEAGIHPQGAAKDFSSCYLVYGTARDLCKIAVDAGCDVATDGEPSAFCTKIAADYIKISGSDIAWSEDMKEDLKFQCGEIGDNTPLPSAYSSIDISAIDPGGPPGN
jgi:hypothetical protein